MRRLRHPRMKFGLTVLGNATHPLRSVLRTERLPEACLFVVAAAALGVGSTLVALPDVYRSSPTLRTAFTHVPPWAWGLAMIIPAVLVAATAVLRRHSAIWPCILLALVWTAWGVSSIPTVLSRTGVPSGTIIYSAVGVLTVLLGLVSRYWDVRPRA